MWAVRKLLSAHAFVVWDVIRAALLKSGSAPRVRISPAVYSKFDCSQANSEVHQVSFPWESSLDTPSAKG
jgi:hypothetical protein